jgi:hypothetical protein
MADKDETVQPTKAAATTPQRATTTPETTTTRDDSGRDRTKPRMSEGVRAELAANGFAIDPATGELLTADSNDKGELSNVQVVDRDKAPAELKRLTDERAKAQESATPEPGPAL